MRRRIAANIAKLPESCCRSRNGEAEEDGHRDTSLKISIRNSVSNLYKSPHNGDDRDRKASRDEAIFDGGAGFIFVKFQVRRPPLFLPLVLRGSRPCLPRSVIPTLRGSNKIRFK